MESFGLWPVDFPFKIFISGNLAGFQFFFSKCPFFQKIIKNPIIKPHTDRRMSRPTIGIMVADSGIVAGILSLTGYAAPEYNEVTNQTVGFAQSAATQNVFIFLRPEIIMEIIIVVLLKFLDVENVNLCFWLI